MPDAAKNDAFREMELYFGTLIRQVDSSLLEEWEKMRDPNYQPRGEQPEVRPQGAEEAERDITRDAKVFTAAIRNRIFAFLRAAIGGECEQALEAIPYSAESDGEPWTAARLRQALDEHRTTRGRIRLDPEARNVRHTHTTLSEDKQHWRVQQMLIDPDEANDWVAEFDADLTASRASGEPVLHLLRVGPLAG